MTTPKQQLAAQSIKWLCIVAAPLLIGTFVYTLLNEQAHMNSYLTTEIRYLSSQFQEMKNHLNQEIRELRDMLEHERRLREIENKRFEEQLTELRSQKLETLLENKVKRMVTKTPQDEFKVQVKIRIAKSAIERW